MSDDKKPELERHVKRSRRYVWGAGVAIVIALVFLALRWASTPTVVISRSELRDVWPASTFKTGALIVDTTTEMGSASVPLTHVLTLRTSSATADPLAFTGAITNTWDMAVMTGSNTDLATVTVFGQTPTTTPSADNTLAFWVTAGTGGAGGIFLSPNGGSYMDPDGYAQHGKILAIGHEIPEYELDVRDPGNAHTSATDCVAAGADFECIVVSAKGSSTFATGAGSNTEYYGVNGEALGTRASGTAQLVNAGLHGRASGGQQNFSLLTDDGDVYLGRNSSGNIKFGRPTEFVMASTWDVGGNIFSSSSSGFNLSVGPLNDDIYFINGNIDYGWNVNSTDHININFHSFQGGAGFFRDLRIYDGKNALAAEFNGANKSLTVQGLFDVVGLVGTNNQFHLGANGIQINSFSGTLVQPVIRSFATNPNGTVTGGAGSLVMDTSGPFLWQNTDGATAWQKIGGFTTGGSVYFGDGTDGTCTFDGVATPVCGATLSGSTYTLTRDTSPLNMAVSAGVTVRTDNWRLFVFNTLSGGGAGATVSNAGFDAVGRLPGNCGGINTRFYSGCSGTGGAGANGTGTGNAGSSNTTSIPQFPTQAASAAGVAGAGHGQGGGGGTAGANAGGTGGALAICGPNCGLFTAVSGFTGKPDGNGTGFGLYGSGGGGGGCTAGGCTGGGGGGGGGILFVGANQCTGTIALISTGGAGGDGVLAGGTNAGGGGGGGGGIVDFIYSHRSATCTTSIAAGAAGAGAGGGASGGAGSTGTSYNINLSGDGT